MQPTDRARSKSFVPPAFSHRILGERDETAGVILDRKRIAVLPFLNISPDPNDAYFADGLTEELIARLSSISGLKVIARTSIMRFRDTTKGVGEIAKFGEIRPIKFDKNRPKMTEWRVEYINGNPYDLQRKNLRLVEVPVSKQNESKEKKKQN